MHHTLSSVPFRADCAGAWLRHGAAFGLLTVLLGACSSPAPARYYTLQPVAGSAAAEADRAVARTATVHDFALQVLPVRVPAAVDQPQILIRAPQGQVLPLDTDRWLGPLSDEIRSAVVSGLTRELGVAEVSAVAVPAGMPVYRLQLDVTRFDTARDQYVLQDINWSLRMMAPAAPVAGAVSTAPDHAAAAPVLLCRSRQVENVNQNSMGALVDAHQRALQRLELQIAGVMRQPPAQWRCPA